MDQSGQGYSILQILYQASILQILYQAPMPEKSTSARQGGLHFAMLCGW